MSVFMVHGDGRCRLITFFFTPQTYWWSSSKRWTHMHHTKTWTNKILTCHWYWSRTIIWKIHISSCIKLWNTMTQRTMAKQKSSGDEWGFRRAITFHCHRSLATWKQVRLLRWRWSNTRKYMTLYIWSHCFFIQPLKTFNTFRMQSRNNHLL